MRDFIKVLLIVSFANVTQASYAYSGAGAECGNSNIESIALFGTPVTLASAIDDRISYIQTTIAENPKYFEPKHDWLHWTRPEVASASPEERRKLFVNWWQGCLSMQVLDFVLAGANLDNAKYVLALGADPNSTDYRGQTLFMRCADMDSQRKSAYPRYARKRTTAETNRRLAIYGLLAAAGGNLNAVDRDGESALVLCNDPDSIRFFVDHGADPYIQGKNGNVKSKRFSTRQLRAPLQQAIHDWLLDDPSRIGMERTKIFASAGKNDIRGLEIEQTLRRECAKPEKTEVCDELSSLLRSSPGTFPRAKYRSRPGLLDRSEFSAIRELCEFPEISYVSDYTAVAIAHECVSCLPKTGMQIDQSGLEAVRMDVVVNSPDKPIFVLVSNDANSAPAIWNFSVTQGTQILGVAVAGYSSVTNVVAGLDPPIAIVTEGARQRHVCGRLHLNAGQAPIVTDGIGDDSLNPFTRKLERTYVTRNATVVIGDPIKPGETLLQSSTRTVESFRGVSGPLVGDMALEDAVRNGQLRRATKADIESWERTMTKGFLWGAKTKKMSIPLGRSTYVVLGDYEYPKGLLGGHRADFVVPKGVAPPRGDIGHSAVYDLNTLKCAGVMCKYRD